MRRLRLLCLAVSLATSAGLRGLPASARRPVLRSTPRAHRDLAVDAANAVLLAPLAFAPVRALLLSLSLARPRDVSAPAR